MRIDQKYFNVFLLIVGVVAAILIAVFMLSNRSEEKAVFQDRMLAQDSLQTVWWPKIQAKDSVRISDFKGKFVVLDYWANWSDASVNSHSKLAQIYKQYPDTLRVLAASVGLQKNEVLSYINKHQFPFQFVAGSKHFSSFNVPGLPAQLIYNPQGKLEHVFLGYSDSSQYDSLKSLIEKPNE